MSCYPYLLVFGENPKALLANKYMINTETFQCPWQSLYDYLTLTAASDLQSVVLFLYSWHSFYFCLEYSLAAQEWFKMDPSYSLVFLLFSSFFFFLSWSQKEIIDIQVHWMWSTEIQLKLINNYLNSRFLMPWNWENEKKSIKPLKNSSMNQWELSILKT